MRSTEAAVPPPPGAARPMRVLSLHARAPLGRMLRLPLRLIPPGTTVPILATAARGKQWIAGSGPHSCWLGINEVVKRKRFSTHVLPGHVVYDIGANVGSYTLLASVLTGPRGTVVAFEPVPENIAYLRRHIALNQLTNVQVHDVAVADVSGVVSFHAAADRVLGRIDSDGQLSVRAVRLDQVVQDGLPPPDCLKIDVEGAEAAVLRGAAGVLKTHRPVVFLATHGEQVHAECLAVLRNAGYAVSQIGADADELIALPR